jgi:hypothetical protein
MALFRGDECFWFVLQSPSAAARRSSCDLANYHQRFTSTKGVWGSGNVPSASSCTLPHWARRAVFPAPAAPVTIMLPYFHPACSALLAALGPECTSNFSSHPG